MTLTRIESRQSITSIRRNPIFEKLPMYGFAKNLTANVDVKCSKVINITPRVETKLWSTGTFHRHGEYRLSR